MVQAFLLILKNWSLNEIYSGQPVVLFPSVFFFLNIIIFNHLLFYGLFKLCRNASFIDIIWNTSVLSLTPGWDISVITLQIGRYYTSNQLLIGCFVLYSLIQDLAFFQNPCKLFGPGWMISWMSWVIFGCFLHTHTHTHSWKRWVTKKSKPWAQTEALPR